MEAASGPTRVRSLEKPHGHLTAPDPVDSVRTRSGRVRGLRIIGRDLGRTAGWIVQYELESPALLEAIAKSKYKDIAIRHEVQDADLAAGPRRRGVVQEPADSAALALAR